MKASICLLAAGLLILPAGGNAAEKADIHEVMTAQEHHGSTAPAERASDEESVLAEEMDELGDEPAGSHEEERTSHPAHEAAAAQESAAKEPAPQDGGHGIGIAPVASDAAYGAATGSLSRATSGAAGSLTARRCGAMAMGASPTGSSSSTMTSARRSS